MVPSMKMLPFYLFLAFCISPGLSIYHSQISRKSAINKKVTPLRVAKNVIRLNATAVKIDADKLHPFKHGYAVIEKGESFALIDATGKIVVPYNKYSFPYFGFINGLCIVMEPTTKRWGMMNNKLELILPCKYAHIQGADEAGYFWAGMEGEASPNGQYLIDKHGKTIADLSIHNQKFTRNNYRRLGLEPYMAPLNLCVSFANGDYANTNKHGYTNGVGVIKIPFIFDDAMPFSEGLAAVAKKDEFNIKKWGFIDTQGKLVIPYTYTNKPGNFHSGRALIEPVDKQEFEFAYIDRSGKIVIKLGPEGDCKISRSNDKFLEYRYSIVPDARADFINGYAKLYRSCRNDRQSGGIVLMDTTGKYSKYTDLLVQHGWSNNFYPHSAFVNNEIILSNGNATVKTYAIANAKGEIIIETPAGGDMRGEIDDLFDPVSNLTRVRLFQNNKVTSGYVNRQGEMIIVKAEEALW